MQCCCTIKPCVIHMHYNLSWLNLGTWGHLFMKHFNVVFHFNGWDSKVISWKNYCMCVWKYVAFFFCLDWQILITILLMERFKSMTYSFFLFIIKLILYLHENTLWSKKSGMEYWSVTTKHTNMTASVNI